MRGQRSHWTGGYIALLVVVAAHGPGLRVASAKPTLAITSPPDRAAVSGETWVNTSYRSDSNKAIVRLELRVDGQPAQDYVLPVPRVEGEKSFALDASRLKPGSHKVQVRAIDAGGEAGGAEITVVAQGVEAALQADRAAPTVTIYAPAQGATVSGRHVMVKAEATDDVGVRHVVFYVDGQVHTIRMNAPPYVAEWDTTTVPDGPHTLEARAKDAAENVSISAPVTVIVQNKPAPRSPARSVGPVPGMAPSGRTTAAPEPVVVVPPGAVTPVPSGPTAPSVPAVTAPPVSTPVPVPPAEPTIAAAPAEPVASPAPLPSGLELAAPDVTTALPMPEGPRAVTPASELGPADRPPELALAPGPALAAVLGPESELSLGEMKVELPVGTGAVVTPGTLLPPEPVAPTPAETTPAGPATESAGATATGTSGAAGETAPAVVTPQGPGEEQPGEVMPPPPTEEKPAEVTPEGPGQERPGEVRAEGPGEEESAETTAARPTEGQDEVRPEGPAGVVSGPEVTVPAPRAVAPRGPGRVGSAVPSRRPGRAGLRRLKPGGAAEAPAGAREAPTAVEPAGPALEPPAPAEPAVSEVGEPPAVPVAQPVEPVAEEPQPAPAGAEPGPEPSPVVEPPSGPHPITPQDAEGLKQAQVVFEGRVLPDAARPEVIGGVVMISLKHIFEAADGALYWFADEKRGRAITSDADVSIQIGSTRAVVNGESRELATAPVLVEGRVMVPLDLVMGALRMSFGYDPQTQQVIVKR